MAEDEFEKKGKVLVYEINTARLCENVPKGSTIVRIVMLSDYQKLESLAIEREKVEELKEKIMEVVNLYKDSEHPINEILIAMSDNLSILLDSLLNPKKEE